MPYLITLPPYGFFWFSLEQEAANEPEKVLPREITTLVLGEGWDSPLSGWTRRTFEGEVLPAFMPDRRWFADKTSSAPAITVSAAVPIEHGNDRFAAVVVDVAGAQGSSRYFPPAHHPLDALHGDRQSPGQRARRGAPRPARRHPARRRRPSPNSSPRLLAKIHAGADAQRDDKRIEFRPTAAFAAQPAPEVNRSKAAEREQSNQQRRWSRTNMS